MLLLLLLPGITITSPLLLLMSQSSPAVIAIVMFIIIVVIAALLHFHLLHHLGIILMFHTAHVAHAILAAGREAVMTMISTIAIIRSRRLLLLPMDISLGMLLLLLLLLLQHEAFELRQFICFAAAVTHVEWIIMEIAHGAFLLRVN